MDNIKAKTVDGVSVIELSGRIDSKNASKISDEAMSYDLKEPVVIDAENLNYISSAGLRIVLKLKKKYRNIKVINVSSEVYEIFDVTGFTEMMTIEKGYKKVNVEGCEVIGEGANGKVYRIDADTIVKVYKNPDSLEDIINERTLAKKAFVLGIPTAISYDIVRVGEGYASMFEKLTAKSLAMLVKEHPENVDEYTKMSVDLLKIIHDTEVEPDEMPLMKPVAYDWVDKLHGYIPEEVIDKINHLIEQTGRDYSLIHGDYHFKNVMVQDGEAMLIDMDTLCTGHPIYEFGSIYNAYQGFGIVDHNVIEKFLGIPYDTACRIWQKTLEYYFDTNDQTVLDDIEKKAKLIGTVRLMQRAIRVKESQEFIDACQKKIVDLAAQVDTLTF